MKANKIQWTPKVVAFIKRNNSRMTNGQMAKVIACAPSTVAWKRSQLGLKKMEMEYWTAKQVEVLKSLYKHVGDKEIAMMFSEAFPKKKGWTLKHIEKKRKYLDLKRTPAELKGIKQRNRLFGCWKVGIKHTKETIGVAPVGTVRIWKNPFPIEVIKTETCFERHARNTWQKHFGAIPKGMNVVRKELEKSEGDINNLELITNAELGRRNSMFRYPTELKDAITLLNQLNKRLYEKQNSRCA